MIDLGPPPLIFPKPAIIRPSVEDGDLLKAIGVSFMPLASYGGRASVAYGELVNSGSSLTTYNFSGVGFGEAAADRYIIACVAGTATENRSLSSVTIGDVSAGLHATTGGVQIPTGVAVANVPTGASGTVSITFTSGMVGCRANIYIAHGVRSGTPVGTFAPATDTSAPLTNSATVDVSSGGFIVAGASYGTNSTQSRVTSASRNYAGAVTGQPVDVDASSNNANWTAGVDEDADAQVGTFASAQTFLRAYGVSMR
jgi:hypothetical protein